MRVASQYNSAMFIDSHCHLDLITSGQEATEIDVQALLDTAREYQVEAMLCVSISLERFPAMLQLIEPYPQIFASVGVHPTQPCELEPEVDQLVALADQAKVIAIGETGLDYYHCQGDVEWQRERFRRHIAAARQAAKPLIIHTREARQDTLDILRAEKAQDAGGVMHCFVEDWATAKAAMDLGFYISFSGIVTFKNATDLKEIARKVPLERLLIETDSPYLAPVPKRGKTNQPAYVKHVAEYIARLRGISVEEIARISSDNFYSLFASAQRPGCPQAA